MPYDGSVTHAIVSELNTKIINFRVDKIYQPCRTVVVLVLRGVKKSIRLLISCDASAARVHITDIKYDNPESPPMFCMLLRKHLLGSKVVAVLQHEFDRIIKIEFECYTEIGDLTKRTLISEIMGKHSNIILIGYDDKILGAAKRVDFTVSEKRQILPNLFYILPSVQGKINPIGALEDLSAHFCGDDLLFDTYMGVSPKLAKMLSGTKTGAVQFFKDIKSQKYYPTMIMSESGKPVDFFCVDFATEHKEHFASMSQCIDEYYKSKESAVADLQKLKNLVKIVSNNIKRCEKKIAIYRENIEKSARKDTYKMFGDLLTTNIYKTKYGMRDITVENYYCKNSNETITIPLQINKSPSQNAQMYYKMYNKAKQTEKHSKDQIKAVAKEKNYLESVLEALRIANTETELEEINLELIEQKYIKRKRHFKQQSVRPSKCMEFTTSDGYIVLVGKNNKQNDTLTLKSALPTDIWLHTKSFPGCHVIIKTQGKKEASSVSLKEAASLAAYYSRARQAQSVAVDYTNVKNVKKTPSAKPGAVFYKNYRTIFVTPSANEINVKT